ncbi:hypothetical protein MRX96_031158 [Rhipicephalus microplus]
MKALLACTASHRTKARRRYQANGSLRQVCRRRSAKGFHNNERRHAKLVRIQRTHPSLPATGGRNSLFIGPGPIEKSQQCCNLYNRYPFRDYGDILRDVAIVPHCKQTRILADKLKGRK